MSAVSTAYDALETRIAALLNANPADPAFLKIPNPYQLEENSDGVLRKGFGIKIGQASNVMAVNCNYHIDRVFGVVLAREAMNTDHDSAGIAKVEKQLMEDLTTIIRDFEVNQSLNTGLIFCGYLGDGGIELIRNDQSFLAVEAQFRIKIVQSLT